MKTRLALLACAAILAAGCERKLHAPPAEPQAQRQESAASASVQSAQTGRRSLVPADGWREGIHYERITPQQPTSTTSGKIEVIEFFWYACPHCRDLEPVLEYWEHGAPEDVSLILVPVTWQKDSERTYARMFYTLQRLGRLDLHRPFLDAVEAAKKRDKKNRLDTFDDQKNFVVGHGIDPQTFAATYHSAEVSEDAAKADRMALDYGIHGTPSMVVQGKYRTTPGKAGGLSQTLILTDELIARERGQ